MSKSRAQAQYIFIKALGPLFVLLSANIGAHANAPTQVTISVTTTSDITIEAGLSTPSQSWSFRNAYAGVLGIAERVHDFRATSKSDQDAVAKKITGGEFRSDFDATWITYKIRTSEPTAADVSHASWLFGDRGLLMFADLIPREIESLSVEFKLPAEWTIQSSISPASSGRYEISDPEKAVFLVGHSLRKNSNIIDGMELDLVISGTWPFKENKAVDAAAKVLKEYLALTGFRLPGKSVIMIAPLPVATGSTKWRAETRGSTVVLLIDPSAGFNNWIGQLTVIFTHELLHLWVPNSLKLDGDYDWFFEGFTLYVALRTALKLKVINFKEYLDTLARVYDSYLSYADDVSLLDASERRWTTPGSFVYDKGMLVAFLYDLMLRKDSGGKLTLAGKYRELFSRRAAEHANANEAIIAVLDSAPAMSGFARSYVENSTKLELEQVLPAYGLTLDSSGKKSQLSVSRDLNAEQKQLLRSLGYR